MNLTGTPERDRPTKNLQSFRKSNRRIDYYPAEAALAAINRLVERNPQHSLRELIDALVIAGDEAISATAMQ